jgi:hypothetical protein
VNTEPYWVNQTQPLGLGSGGEEGGSFLSSFDNGFYLLFDSFAVSDFFVQIHLLCHFLALGAAHIQFFSRFIKFFLLSFRDFDQVFPASPSSYTCF